MATVNETIQRIDTLLVERNFLGAWACIKQAGLDSLEESIQIGRLAAALSREIDQCRVAEHREEAQLHRALLAYCLRDYPGLQAIYREQTERGPASLADDFKRMSRTLSDMASGKVSVEAGIKEGLDNAGKRAEEAGLSVNKVARGVEDGIKNGLYGLANFFDSLGSVTQAPSSASDSTAPKAEKSDGETIKVNIQGKDKPLPKDVQSANPEEAGEPAKPVGEKSRKSASQD